MRQSFQASQINPLFFIDISPVSGERITITGNEARHINQARRLRLGARFYFTNGRGRLAKATIVEITTRPVTVSAEVIDVEVIQPAKSEIKLASAIAKGNRQAVLLSMVTQLGIREYIPLICDRSVTRYKNNMYARWQKILVESSKQCRQCYFPRLASPLTLDELLLTQYDDSLLIVADPNGDIIWTRRNMLSDYQSIICLVGPEGGFSDREYALLEKQKVLKLSLGNYILRTETAAASIIAILSHVIL